MAAVLLAGAASAADQPWVAERGRDHPLTGMIWSAGDDRFLEREEFVGRLAAADFVLLGEKHDNPDHHRLQAWTLAALIDAGRRPAVAFEMFDSDRQRAIDAHLAAAPADVDGVAVAGNWAERGWPDWAMYRPIAEAAVAAGLPIVAASKPRGDTRRLARKAAADGFDLAPWMEGSTPLPAAALDDLVDELVVAHCGYPVGGRAGLMAVVQQARDAHMAGRMVDGATDDGAVLIAGAGHTRSDRGVPWHLDNIAPDAAVAAMAFIEVSDAATEPAGYSGMPFDYLWFTPAVASPDPCEKYRESLERLDDHP